MIPRFLILVSFLALVVTACSRHPVYTEQDVRSFVVPGTPLEAIIQRFGQPTYVEKNPKFEDGSTEIDEIVYFDLPLPPPGVKEDYAFAGFQVRLKNGKAVNWFSTHRSIG